jgi:predicted RNA-binding protein YlqC (UPF0109 family)
MVKRIANEITFHHKELKVYAREAGLGWTVFIEAHRGDIPRLIGGGGQTFKALDAVCALIGNKYRMGIRLTIDEERAVGEKDRYETFKHAENWNKEGILRLLEDLCRAILEEPARISTQDERTNRTVIIVLLSKKEVPAVAEAAKKALGILFNAIGKANGRLVSLDVGTEGQDSPRDLSKLFG